MKQFFKRVPRLERIFCCLPLRGGVIALVYINLILSLTAIIGFAIMDIIKIILQNYSIDTKEYYERMRRNKLGPEVMLFVLGLCGIAEIVMFVFGLVGIHKNKVIFLKLHLYFSVCLALLLFTYRISDTSMIWQLEVPIALLYIVIQIYYIIAVRSLVKKMIEQPADGDRPPLEMVVSYKDNELNGINIDNSNDNDHDTQNIETISVTSNGDSRPLVPDNHSDDKSNAKEK